MNFVSAWCIIAAKHLSAVFLFKLTKSRAKLVKWGSDFYFH